MDLRQLKYFCYAANTESIAETARHFQVPSSTVSISIRRLEAELSTPLFTRTANRVKLNSEGQYFYKGVSDALNLLDETARTLVESKQKETIRVGIRLGRRFVTNAVNLFRAKHPKVDVVFGDFDTTSCLKDFDVVVSDDSLEDADFSKEVVLRDKVMLVAAKGVLPEKEHLSAEDLKDLAFVSYSPGSPMYLSTIDICKQLGFEPKIITQPNHSIYSMPRRIEEGGVVALIPGKSRWVTMVPDLLDKRDIGEFYRVSCVYCRKKGASLHTKQLHDTLLEIYKRERRGL